MEKREGEDLPWLTSENFRQFSSSPRPQNNPRNPPVPPSHQVDSPARFFSPENQILLPENSSTIRSSQPEIHPFRGETYSSSIYPPSDIEAAFSRLNVSNPLGHAPAPSGQGSVMGHSGLPAMSDVELHGQRVLSAARGQGGLGEEISTNYGLNSIGVRDLFTETNRHPPRIGSSINQDGFSMVNTDLYRMGIRAEKLDPILAGMRGQIYLKAKEQRGSRFLQEKVEKGKFANVGLIFLEIKDRLPELMVDPFGNYLTQKLFEVCNQGQITEMLDLVISNERQLLHICDDTHGTYAMRKLLKKLTPWQRSKAIYALGRITVDLTKSENGCQVIQYCLIRFSDKENKHLLDVVAENCLDIAMDENGLCVLKDCVRLAHGDAQRRIVNGIATNALVLSENLNGNYAVRFILGMAIPHVMANILRQLAGSFVSLSMNRFGSMVVVKCLEESEEDQASEIIREIITSPNFLMVLQDPFGNCVAQSALTVAKENLRRKMLDQIQILYPFLDSNPHGKKVLDHARAISGNNTGQQQRDD